VFCSRCGAAIAADAAFCQSCGTPVGRTAVAIAPTGVVSPHAGVGAIPYVSNVVYAGFWLRFFAYLIDKIILSIGTSVLIVPFFFLFGGESLINRLPLDHPEELYRWAPFISLIVLLTSFSMVVQWLYSAYLESGEKQGTWGKQFLGIYVTDLAGNRISFGAATARYFAKIVTGLIPFALGYIMAGFTERRQALHDMIASTLVLRR
jgi:uncharacterized RDD family membrane protein YckC